MIGLDTNVLVRYFTRDDPHQYARAAKQINSLTQTDPGFVSIVTLVELYWVLRRAYEFSATDCYAVVAGVVNAKELRIDRADTVRSALAACEVGLDFADALIAELGHAAGCRFTVTFDRRAARSPAMQLLETE